jgi:hypothetical protein
LTDSADLVIYSKLNLQLHKPRQRCLAITALRKRLMPERKAMRREVPTRCR